MNFFAICTSCYKTGLILLSRQFLLQILVGVPTFLETIEMCPNELTYI
jgi:hypothetical protein